MLEAIKSSLAEIKSFCCDGEVVVFCAKKEGVIRLIGTCDICEQEVDLDLFCDSLLG